MSGSTDLSVPLDRLSSNADAPVDIGMLGRLIEDQYQPFSRADDAAQRLLAIIEDFENQAPSRASDSGSAAQLDCVKRSITVKTLAQFLRVRDSELGRIFADLDTNKDHVIDLDDIVNYLEYRKLDYDLDKMEMLYNILDKDGDGVVSLNEFKHQLLLIPSRHMHRAFFNDAYEFFVDELEINPDSDVYVSSESRHGLGYFWAGGIAGVVSRTCTAPFDRLKVYLISATTGKRDGIGLLDAVKTIYKSGGLLGFFVGNGLNVVKVFPESAIKFGGFESAKRLFASLEGVDDPAHISRLSTFVAGGLGGMVSQLCVYPIDTLKFRVQVESLSSAEKGHKLVATTVHDMIKKGGIYSFYRGITVGVIGIFPFAALDLGIFSWLKTTYAKRLSARHNVPMEDVEMSNMAVLTMGAISGSLGASTVYPINLIRTRIQTQGTRGSTTSYKGFWDAVRQTKAAEGWRGFFRGLGPNIVKVAPSVSISYVVYENAKNLMGLQ